MCVAWCSLVALALALPGIFNCAPTVMLQIVASRTADYIGVIYDRSMFIVQAYLLEGNRAISSLLMLYIYIYITY
jgi:hypothetical protein